MFTVCPKCALTLVVTAADLRIAQGYVRCGRCLNVFNALARLSEERPAGAPAPPPDTVGPTSPAAAAEGPEHGAEVQPSEPAAPSAAPAPSAPPPPDDTGEIEVELDASFLAPARTPAALHATVKPQSPVNDPRPAPPASPSATTAEPASAALATTAEPASAAPAVSPEPAPAAVAAPAERASVALAAPASVAKVPRDPAPAPSASVSSPAKIPETQQTNTEPQQSAEAFELITRRPRVSLAWTLGAGALLLALVLQIVNHYRDALAANPALRGPLSTVYSALGVRLAPHWNIKAYDVRQLGASVSGAAAGEIVVRASIKNAARRAQPLPLLRVVLQDRFGNRIAARDVPPRDYLPSPLAPGSLLAAGSRVDATMVFVDPGPQAVGFEIDACLPLKSGEMACAHGP